MARFSAIRHWLFKMLNARSTVQSESDRSQLVRAAMLADAISVRESQGQTTSLRQLHTIAPLAQPEALKAVTELEKHGMIEIEHNLYDALDSQVTLTEKMRRNIERGIRCNAA